LLEIQGCETWPGCTGLGLSDLWKKKEKAPASWKWAADKDAFIQTFMGDIPLELSDGWIVTSLKNSLVRRGFELCTERDADQFLIFAEPRSDVHCLVSTQYLNLSHGDLPAGLEGPEAHRLIEALVARFKDVEQGLSEEAVDAIFSGPDQGQSGGVYGGHVEIRISRECNERCLFCNTPPEHPDILTDSAVILRTIERERERGFSKIIITGREPTLHPELPTFVRRARDVGFESIMLQTNATRLEKRSYLKKLLRAGVNEFHISLHTFSPETFEMLVGKAHLLEKTLKALDNLVSTSMPARNLTDMIRRFGRGPNIADVRLLFVITRQNYNQMATFVEKVGERYGKGISLVLLSGMGPFGDGATRVGLMPPLSGLHAELKQAFTIGDAKGLDVRIPPRCGLPLCVTPETHRERNSEWDRTPGDYLEERKSYAAACDECTLKERCGGIWSRYLEEVGDSEVIPVT
tara:strand:+ start:1686 stop:3077 length:1392 start_codon:yes stop_codon:yes gene_type:complete